MSSGLTLAVFVLVSLADILLVTETSKPQQNTQYKTEAKLKGIASVKWHVNNKDEHNYEQS